MRTKLTGLALVGTLGVSAFGGAALLSPAVSYAASGAASAVTGRVAKITKDLSGLVSDGTITQAQADKVATTLDAKLPPGGHGRHGGFRGREGLRGQGLAAAAKVLGLTEQQVREQLRSGQSLAQVATSKGVSQDKLVGALVDAARAQLAAAVKDGRLTQAQADARSGTLTARITAGVTRVRPPHEHGGPAAPDGAGPNGPAPAPNGTPASPKVTSSSYTA